MLLDRAALTRGDVLRADVCVVGAGPAGISVARALAAAGRSTLLLEGGGFEPSERSQELYDGDVLRSYRVGRRERRVDEAYLLRSRLRYFGGASNHWNGWCLPLEPEDFTRRAWIEHSGWPITRDELSPWYAAAGDVIKVSGFGANPNRRRARRPRLSASERVRTRVFHFSRQLRLGPAYRQELVDSNHVEVLVEANVLRLHADPDVRHVTRADVQLEDGPPVTVQARAFVLAAGGIENARLLLLSNQEAPAGLGNDRDLVGRYFMDHPHVTAAGVAVLPHAAQDSNVADLYLKRAVDASWGGRTVGVWIVDAAVREAEQLLGCSVQLRIDPDVDLGRLGVGVQRLAAGMRRLRRDQESDARAVRVFAVGEQRPNPESRLTLGEDRDRLGLRRARLDWRLSEAERRSIRRTLELFASEAGAGGLGRIRLDMAADGDWPTTRGGDHHMGTTRMASDPAHGVVDAQCRVHGLDNLWIAGSSVFPTCGFVNPTFTIVALALRLADRVEGSL